MTSPGAAVCWARSVPEQGKAPAGGGPLRGTWAYTRLPGPHRGHLPSHTRETASRLPTAAPRVTCPQLCGQCRVRTGVSSPVLRVASMGLPGTVQTPPLLTDTTQVHWTAGQVGEPELYWDENAPQTGGLMPCPSCGMCQAWGPLAASGGGPASGGGAPNGGCMSDQIRSRGREPSASCPVTRAAVGAVTADALRDGAMEGSPSEHLRPLGATGKEVSRSLSRMKPSCNTHGAGGDVSLPWSRFTRLWVPPHPSFTEMAPRPSQRIPPTPPLAAWACSI